MLLSEPLTNWWLELEVTPVTIDGLTVGNLESSHKSYKSVLAAFAVGALLEALADILVEALVETFVETLIDDSVVTLLRLLYIALACLKFTID